MADFWPMVDWDAGDEQEYEADRRDQDYYEREVGGHPRWSDDNRSATLAHGGVEHQTVKAVLYKFGERTIWLPKSKTTDDGTRVTVPRWMVHRNGLDAYLADEGGE